MDLAAVALAVDLVVEDLEEAAAVDSAVALMVVGFTIIISTDRVITARASLALARDIIMVEDVLAAF